MTREHRNVISLGQLIGPGAPTEDRPVSCARALAAPGACGAAGAILYVVKQILAFKDIVILLWVVHPGEGGGGPTAGLFSAEGTAFISGAVIFATGLTMNQSSRCSSSSHSRNTSKSAGFSFILHASGRSVNHFFIVMSTGYRRNSIDRGGALLYNKGC